jgi:ankyrin repeat protein
MKPSLNILFWFVSAIFLTTAPAVAKGEDNDLAELLRFLASPGRYIESLDCRRLYKEAKTPEDYLVAAAVCRDSEGVNLLIDAGINVDSWASKDYKKRSVLHRAVGVGGNVEIIKLLLSRGATIDKTAVDGSTPLETAAWFGRTAVVKYLLEQRANPNIAGFHGAPLHAAVGGGHLEVVELLLKAGANPNIRIGASGIEPGATPLHRHSWRGVWPTFPQIAKLLVENGADVNATTAKGATPLEFAEKESFLVLLKLGGSIRPERPIGVVALAARLGATDALEYLLSNEYPVNAPSGTSSPLHSAISNIFLSDETHALLLLDRGADAYALDKDGWTPFELAIRQCLHKTVKRIMKSTWPKDIDLRKVVNAPIIGSYPSREICNTILRELIEGGVDVNRPDSNGRTALFGALQYPDTVELLLKYGAQPNVIDRQGIGILHDLRNAKPESVAILIKAGVNPNRKDQKGDSPLHHLTQDMESFSSNSVFALARALVDGGARIDLTNDSGLTPLDIALAYWNQRMQKGGYPMDQAIHNFYTLLGYKG